MKCRTPTGQDNHVHSPEDTHDPAHHDNGSEDLDEGRRNVEPEHAAHVAVRQVRPGTAQHRERWDKCAFFGTDTHTHTHTFSKNIYQINKQEKQTLITYALHHLVVDNQA